MKISTRILLGLAVIAAAVAGAWVARHTVSEPTAVALQFGTPLSPPEPVPDFALVSQDGAAYGQARLEGHWSLMFFGFAHCPAICPTTLAMLADVGRRVSDLGPESRPQLLFVTVDPERDTPAALQSYVRQFDAALIGLTGQPEAVKTFANSMGVAYRKLPMAGDEYMMDHTVAVFVLDPQGRRVAIFTPPFEAAHLAADYRRMAGKS